MKVSTRVQYGMLALTDIALYSENGSAVSGPEIAERQDISQKYLEQILTHLKQAGLIRAQKGLRGGYTLARPADQIRLSEPMMLCMFSAVHGAGRLKTASDIRIMKPGDAGKHCYRYGKHRRHSSASWSTGARPASIQNAEVISKR